LPDAHQYPELHAADSVLAAHALANVFEPARDAEQALHEHAKAGVASVDE
jgi:hypothetical protein